MGFLSRMAAAIGGGRTGTSYPLSDPRIAGVFSAPDDGVTVNEWTALNLSAVWCAVRVISEAISLMPWDLFRRTEGEDREHAAHHPVEPIVRRAPNSQMSAQTWKEVSVAHALSWGNCYSEIERRNDGRPAALHLLTPDRVLPDRNVDGDYGYRVKNFGRPESWVRPENMLHVPGLGYDGLMGYSVVTMARESLAFGKATERHGTGFYSNAARPSGVLKFPGSAEDMKRKKIRENWEALYQGPLKAGKTAILYGGLEYQALGIAPHDAQFLETRAFQVVEVARWFNLPPHKLKDLSRATFSNIEEQNAELYSSTLLYWAVKFEQEANRKLLTEDERTEFYTEHNSEYLMRGRLKERYDAYAVGRQWGFLSANDIRRRENMNTIGPQGDIYLSPANMVSADRAGEVAAPAAPPPTRKDQDPPAPNKDRKAEARLIAALRSMFAETARRLVRKEAMAARKAAKSPKTFCDWVGSFYAHHRDLMVEAFGPIVAGHLALTGSAESPETAAAEFADGQRRQSADALLDLAGVVTAAGLPEAVDALASRWEQERPQAMADGFFREPHALD